MKKVILLVVMCIVVILSCFVCSSASNVSDVSISVESDVHCMEVLSDSSIMYRYAYMIELDAPSDVHSVVVKIPSRYEFRHGEKTDTVAEFDGSFVYVTNAFSTYVLYTSKKIDAVIYKSGDCSLK